MILIEMSQQEFGALVERHRNELQAHCYQLIGTVQDAEDMVQETFLRAWQRRETYVEDASLRAWLYKIATNICLDALKKQRRRVIPITLGSVADVEAAIPPAIMEPIWLDPYPDELLPPSDDLPEARILTKESVSIAFLAALQMLPPRQRAALLLSDVLDWRASEVADLLETTVAAVKSMLSRARAKLALYHTDNRDELALQTPDDTLLKGRLDAYVLAWETADVEGLINLLRDDATFSMPPIPSWYQGKEVIRTLVSKTIFTGAARGRWRLLPTRANKQVAFGLYRQNESGGHDAYGIQVLTLEGSLLSDIITFRHPTLIARFKLPPVL